MRDIENSFQHAKVREFYTEIRREKDRFKASINNIEDEYGKIKLDDNQLLQRWENYFTTGWTPANDDSTFLNAKNRLENPAVKEAANGIKVLKRRKPKGPDDIAAELLKEDGEDIIRVMHCLTSKI